LIVAAMVAASFAPAILVGCSTRPGPDSQHPSVSRVPPRDGEPINQDAVYPDREKIIMKKPPAQ
jgi:hypothetical protein